MLVISRATSPGNKMHSACSVLLLFCVKNISCSNSNVWTFLRNKRDLLFERVYLHYYAIILSYQVYITPGKYSARSRIFFFFYNRQRGLVSHFCWSVSDLFLLTTSTKSPPLWWVPFNGYTGRSPLQTPARPQAVPMQSKLTVAPPSLLFQDAVAGTNAPGVAQGRSEQLLLQNSVGGETASQRQHHGGHRHAAPALSAGELAPVAQRVSPATGLEVRSPGFCSGWGAPMSKAPWRS